VVDRNRFKTQAHAIVDERNRVKDLDNHSGSGRLIGPRAAFLVGATSTGSGARALSVAGIPLEMGLHLHDLRHTGSTWSAQSGATLKELMARIGHSSARAAMIYQHATRDRDQP
jgi:integrase